MTGPRRWRDLVLSPLGRGRSLVVACDGLGGIGPKPADVVCAPGYVVGRFTARVALMELLAVRARPLLLSCALSVEPEPTGTEILRGVCDEAALAGLPAAAVAVSSEKNVPTIQTGVGVTAVGIVRGLRLAQAGDAVVALGRPKVGAAVRLDDPEIADLPLVQALGRRRAAHDMLPVGSAGILAEARDLAASAGLALQPAASAGWDLAASAGPATSLLLAAPQERLRQILRRVRQPWAIVGRLEAPES